MESGGHLAMPLPPGEPGDDQRQTRGQDKEGSREQMLSLPQTRSVLSACGNTQAEQVGQDEQDERQIAVPAVITADLVVVHTDVLPIFKILFNGLITNDKFCMSRTATLQLSWWRLPRSVRQTDQEGVQSPVEEYIPEQLPQQERDEKTTMEHSAQLRRTA